MQSPYPLFSVGGEHLQKASRARTVDPSDTSSEIETCKPHPFQGRVTCVSCTAIAAHLSPTPSRCRRGGKQREQYRAACGDTVHRKPIPLPLPIRPLPIPAGGRDSGTRQSSVLMLLGKNSAPSRTNAPAAIIFSTPCSTIATRSSAVWLSKRESERAYRTASAQRRTASGSRLVGSVNLRPLCPSAIPPRKRSVPAPQCGQ